MLAQQLHQRNGVIVRRPAGQCLADRRISGAGASMSIAISSVGLIAASPCGTTASSQPGWIIVRASAPAGRRRRRAVAGRRGSRRRRCRRSPAAATRSRSTPDTRLRRCSSLDQRVAIAARAVLARRARKIADKKMIGSSRASSCAQVSSSTNRPAASTASRTRCSAETTVKPPQAGLQWRQRLAQQQMRSTSRAEPARRGDRRVVVP